MAATFRTRPWLLAPARSTSLSCFLVGAPRLRAPTTGQTRSYAKRIDPQTRMHKARATQMTRMQPAASTAMNDMLSEMRQNNPAELAILTPGTIVPLSRPNTLKLFYERPKVCLEYLWTVLKAKLRDRLGIMQYSIRAKGGLFKKYRRPQFKPTRKGIVEEATKLHVLMSRCVAAGGRSHRNELSKICTPKLYSSLLALIDSRPAGKSYKWERLELLGRPFWPQVVDYKWSEMPVGPGVSITSRQAVVGIKSRQRLTELNRNGHPVKPPKEMMLTEYLVLWRNVNMDDQTLGPWLISGTLKETTPEEVQEELRTLTSIGNMRAEEALEEQKKRVAQPGTS